MIARKSALHAVCRASAAEHKVGGRVASPRRRWSRTVVGLLSLVLVAACSNTTDDNRLVQELGTYLLEIDAIDASWRSGVEAAYEGREYLAEGDLPEGFWTSSGVLQDVIENLEQLVAATDQAVSSAADVEPPKVAAEFHSEWVLLLTDLRRVWAAGLEPLRERDFERFFEVYAQVTKDRANLNTRLTMIGEDRNRLVDEALNTE